MKQKIGFNKIDGNQSPGLYEPRDLNNTTIIILLTVLGVVPLLLRLIILKAATPMLGESAIGPGPVGDIFTYYKLVGLSTGTIVVSAMFIYSLCRKKVMRGKSYINLPTAVMYFFLLLSGLMAEYKTITLLGQYNRHEGTLVYLCYLALFFVASNLTYNEKQLKWLNYPLYLFVIVNSALGLIWFYNYNLLNQQWFFNLIVPTGNVLGPGSYIVNTISNPDFSSGIGAVLATFFLIRAILTKELRLKLLNLFFAMLSFTMIPTSIARSGFYTMIVLLPLVLVMVVRFPQKKQGITTLVGGLCAFTLVFVILSYHNPALWERSKTLGFSDTNGVETAFVAVNPFAAEPANAETAANTADEFKLPAQGWAPGTGRLYIWQETAKLIRKHPLLGYGMDTLPFYFPQNDPNKNSGLNSPDTIVDKPHNFFLDIAFGAGLITLFAFFLLLCRHLYINIKFLKHGITDEKHATIAALFGAWCAFLVQGIFNDSTIATAPFFWILFGIAVALLRSEFNEDASLLH